MMQHQDDGVGTADRLLRESDPAWGLAADEAVDKAVVGMIAGVAPGRPVRRRWWRSPVFVTAVTAGVLGMGAGAAIAVPLGALPTEDTTNTKVGTTIEVLTTAETRCEMTLQVAPSSSDGRLEVPLFGSGTSTAATFTMMSGGTDTGSTDPAELAQADEFLRTTDWTTLLAGNSPEEPPYTVMYDPRLGDGPDDALYDALNSVTWMQEAAIQAITDAGLNTHGSARIAAMTQCTAVTK